MTSALSAPTPSTHPARHGRLALGVGAIGVVFGDIGTSPLYAMQAVFSAGDHAVAPSRDDVLGVISMVLWSITIIVSFKYVALAMRADNEGEGGILALVALLRDRLPARGRAAGSVLIMGMFGAALFYGDSVITPAISVMSALEGVVVVNPGLEHVVLPLSGVILAGLFLVQRWGTDKVGRVFGPVMILWFATLAALGLPHLVRSPEILQAILPTYAIGFLVGHPWQAFLAMGAVVLTITGAEALYADMGHFGAGAIRSGWWLVVFPALAVNYLGQGALILSDPRAAASPFFSLAPGWARLPLVVLATLATVIASQAVISGAFSVSRQAVRLGMLPRLTVRHTSREEGGQIYVPVVNWCLFAGVLLLVVTFQSSEHLATAYGLAVTGTLILTSALFLLLARTVWRVAPWKIVVFVALAGTLEVVFLAANLTKVVSGGWLPLIIALVVVTMMVVWRAGAQRLRERERELGGPIELFAAMLRHHRLTRVPGVAIYPHPNSITTPLALRSNVDFNQVVHEKVVLVRIVNENVPHIRHVDRVTIEDTGHEDVGIVAVSVRVGFSDSQDIPRGLALVVGQHPLVQLDLDSAHYFLSLTTIHSAPWSARNWRTRLFIWMAHNAADRTEVFHLPPERTVLMGASVDL